MGIPRHQTQALTRRGPAWLLTYVLCPYMEIPVPMSSILRTYLACFDITLLTPDHAGVSIICNWSDTHHWPDGQELARMSPWGVLLVDTSIPQQLSKFWVSEENKQFSSCVWNMVSNQACVNVTIIVGRQWLSIERLPWLLLLSCIIILDDWLTTFYFTRFLVT